MIVNNMIKFTLIILLLLILLSYIECQCINGATGWDDAGSPLNLQCPSGMVVVNDRPFDYVWVGDGPSAGMNL